MHTTTSGHPPPFKHAHPLACPKNGVGEGVVWMRTIDLFISFLPFYAYPTYLYNKHILVSQTQWALVLFLPIPIWHSIVTMSTIQSTNSCFGLQTTTQAFVVSSWVVSLTWDPTLFLCLDSRFMAQDNSRKIQEWMLLEKAIDRCREENRPQAQSMHSALSGLLRKCVWKEAGPRGSWTDEQAKEGGKAENRSRQRTD